MNASTGGTSMEPLNYEAPKRGPGASRVMLFAGLAAAALVVPMLLGMLVFARSPQVVVSTPAASAVVAPAPAVAAVTARPAAQAYQPTQTVGDVRVTLLSIGRGAAFFAPGQAATQAAMLAPSDCFEVVYLVEILGQKPVRQFDSSAAVISLGGQELSVPNAAVIDEDIEPEDYKGPLPKISDPARATVRRQQVRGVNLQTGTVNLKLEEGYNDQTESFTFENLPLN